MDEAIVEAVRGGAGLGSLPAPATPEAVTEAEKLIGVPLPPLLRRLYLLIDTQLPSPTTNFILKRSVRLEALKDLHSK
jgi:cell wall assembly regulator SMI1